MTDVYRLVIEHPQWIPIEWQKKLDLRAGHDKGRIWRVAPVGAKLRAVPRLDKLTTAELVAALDSSNGWQRDLAQQLIIDQADSAAVPLLRAKVVQLRSSFEPQSGDRVKPQVRWSEQNKPPRGGRAMAHLTAIAPPGLTTHLDDPNLGLTP